MKNIIGSVVLCLVASTSFALTPLQQQNPETTSSKQVTTLEDKKLANNKPQKIENQSVDRKEDRYNYKNDYKDHKMNSYKESKTAPKTSIEEIEKKDSMNPLTK